MGLLDKKALATVLLAVFAVTIAASVTPVQAPPPMQSPILAELLESGYYQIVLHGSGDTIDVPVESTTYVLHGWVTGGDGWPSLSEMTGKQKGEFLATANFELFINESPVKLQRLVWYDGTEVSVWYFVVLPLDTLADGDEIEGKWSIELDGVLIPYEPGPKTVNDISP